MLGRVRTLDENLAWGKVIIDRVVRLDRIWDIWVESSWTAQNFLN